MPMLLHRWLIAFFLIGLCCISIDAQHERINPYKVLELTRSASADDIKRAYKRLAKKWHPDKNSDPEAHAQFLQVSAAYDILGDDKKKQEYDSYGHTQSQQGGSSSGGVHPQHPYYHYYQQMDDYTRRYNTYHSIHHHGDGQIKLTASNWDHLVYCNDGIDGDIIWLVYFYGDHCSHCVTTLPAWNEVYNKLQVLNDVVRVGKVQTDFESTLVRKLGVRTLPTIHAYVIRNGQQQRQHTYMQRHPITSSSILDWIGNIIEWEGKEESKIYIMHKGVTSATDIVPQLQYRRTQHAQQHPHHVIFYILTVRSRPILLHRYLSQHLITHLHKDVRFVHICLHCITPDVTEQARVAQHVWHVDPLIYKQQAPAPIIVVGREDGTADQVISPVASDFDGLLPQLLQHEYMYIPRLDGDNYYDLCWSSFTRCLIAVTDTVDAARELLLPVILHDTHIYGHPQSTSSSSSIHAGWISKGQQSRWLSSVATATGRRSDSIRVVLIRPKEHQVMIFDGPKQHLIQWVDASLSKEQWISAARHGGLPFLVPSPRPLFSSWRLPSLNLSPQTIASLTELGPLVLTLMFLVLMFFVSAFIRIA